MKLLIFVCLFLIFFAFATEIQSETISCLKCDSSDLACGYLQNTQNGILCSEDVPDGFENFCFINSVENIVTRGCISENLDLLEICKDLSQNCTICYENNCNYEQVVRDRCIICNTNDCISNLDNFEAIECFVDNDIGDYSYEDGGCYRYEYGGNYVQRGCVVSLSQDQRDICELGINCKKCRGDSCNLKETFQECHSCDSEDSIGCVKWPTYMPTKICNNYLDTCTQLVVTDGKTLRGCTEEIDVMYTENCTEKTCEICGGNKCNGVVYPRNRLICYQCNRDPSCYNDMGGYSGFQTACRFYNEQETCYTVVEDDGRTTHRGCLSDRDSESEFCKSVGDRCVLCSTNRCNSKAMYWNPTFRCSKCDSRDESCAYSQYLTSPSSCVTQVKYPEVEMCYTSFEGVNKIKRGCYLDDVEYCKTNNCETCEYQQCNTKNFVYQSCIQCNSSSDYGDIACYDEAKNLTSSPCPFDEYFLYKNRGCYSRVVRNSTNNYSYMERGCYSDISFQEYCLNNDECIHCYEDGCNTDFIGAAVQLTSLPLNILFLIAAIGFDFLQNCIN